jgi:hypothetical protein
MAQPSFTPVIRALLNWEEIGTGTKFAQVTLVGVPAINDQIVFLYQGKQAQITVKWRAWYNLSDQPADDNFYHLGIHGTRDF